MSGALTHGPCDIVGQVLLDLGAVSEAAGTGDWPLGISEDLGSPDNAVGIFDTQGVMHGSEQTQGEVQEQEGILIRVRARDYKTGFTKAKALATLLDQSVHNEDVTIGANTYRVYSINRTSGVIHVGKENSSKRHLFTINATVALTQLS